MNLVSEIAAVVLMLGLAAAGFVLLDAAKRSASNELATFGVIFSFVAAGTALVMIIGK